jgi:alpha-glucosidase (family GH31 glycosyl hydrolase)
MGHAVWSGDTTSDWPTFATQIPTGLGAGLSGIGEARSVASCFEELLSLVALRNFRATAPCAWALLLCAGLWTHDIGGYNPTMQPLDPELQELYVR